MNSKIKVRWFMVSLFTAVFLINCATARKNDFRQYNFSLKDTLSVFLLNNGRKYYFCIPVQYIGDYQITRFVFDNGSIRIGDYEIVLKRGEINIFAYLNETAGENRDAVEEFNLIYHEKEGKVLVSKMAEPLKIKNRNASLMNQYDIYIEKYLTDNEMKNIINEYEKGRVDSRLSIWYDISIENEEHNGNGMLDDFVLYNGPVDEYVWLLPHLEFFWAKYLQK